MFRAVFVACSLPLTLAACTALLGTFEVSNSEGAGDGAASDGTFDTTTTGGDAATDGDAVTDADDGFVPFGCAELTAMRQKLGSYTKNQFALIGPDRIYLATYPALSATSGVVVTRDSQGAIHALTFPLAPSGAVKDISIPMALTGNNAQVLSAKHVGDALYVLVLQSIVEAGAQSPSGLAAYRLEDGDSAWSGPITVTQGGELAGAGFCLLRAAASFEVRETNPRDFVGIVSYVQGKPGTTAQGCAPPYMQRLAAFATRAGTSMSLQAWSVPPDLTALDVPYDAVALNPANVFAMANAVGDGGTGPGTSPTLFRAGSLGAYEAQNKVPLANPQDFLFGTAFGAFGPAGAANDTVAMMGVLGNGNVLDGGSVAYVAGSVPFEALGALSPAAFNKTPVGSIFEIPSNRPATRIEAIGNRAEMLTIGPPPDGIGFNAYWFDQKGRLRWRASKAVPGGVLLAPKDSAFRSSSADMALIAPPSQAGGDLAVAWMEDTGPNDPAKPLDVYVTKLACAK